MHAEPSHWLHEISISKTKPTLDMLLEWKLFTWIIDAKEKKRIFLVNMHANACKKNLILKNNNNKTLTHGRVI